MMKSGHRTTTSFKPFLHQYRVRGGEQNTRLLGFLIAAVGVLMLLIMVGTRLQNALSPPVELASGDLAAAISSHVNAIPRSGSEAYDVPTYSQSKTMGKAFEAIEAGNLSRAASLVDNLEYDVVQYKDTGTGRKHTMLRERQNADGSWPHAWGTYIFSPESTSNTAIEVVHPLADLDSEKVGLETFRRANAKYLLIAGAHRKSNADESADVAHAETSVFEQIHRAAISPSTKVLQPHGFSEAKHPHYGEVLVSPGTDRPTLLAKDISSALQGAGFDARLYDGVSYSELSATTNVQETSTREIGASFLHVELSRSVRDDDSRRAVLTDTLATNLR